MESKTISYMTIAKALGIVLVVCGHIGGIYKFIGIPIYDTKPSEIFPLYSYHMPLFMFVSGYFFKLEYVSNIKLLLNKRIKTLVIPYYKWNLFYGIFVSILIYLGIFKKGSVINFYNLFIEPLFGAYQYNLNGPSWFLLSLFFVQIGYTLLIKLIKIQKYKSLKIDTLILIILFMVTVLVNIWSNNIKMSEHAVPLFISRTIFGIFFFNLGYYFSSHFKDKMKLSIISLIIIILLKYYLNMLLGKNYTLSMRTMILRDMNVVPIIWATLGIFYILNISKLLEKILNLDKFVYIKRVFNFLESNTFAIMMHHMTINFFIGLIIIGLSKSNVSLDVWYDIEDIIKPILCIILSVYFNKYIGKILDKIFLNIYELKPKKI